jgi:hypothetical protein
MISIPVAVHIELFRWQLSLFWYNHQLTYGANADSRVIAAVVSRNVPADPLIRKLAWDTTVPHRIVKPYFECGWNISPGNFTLPVNLQTAVSQVIVELQDDQVIEILDCDMFHIRPAPAFTPAKCEMLVSNVYEQWHLFSLTSSRDIVQRRTGGASNYYNGGFVPIICQVSTIRTLLPAWIEVHLEMLADEQLNEAQKWWAGMYALQVACEREAVRMVHQDVLYVPGVFGLKSDHYIAHYSCDPRFDKKRFPYIDPDKFEDNLFYQRVAGWLSNNPDQ